MAKRLFPKELHDIAKCARAQGWNIERTRNGHVRFVGPDGNIVIGSGTPSDKRANKNMLAALRRCGMWIPRTLHV